MQLLAVLMCPVIRLVELLCCCSLMEKFSFGYLVAQKVEVSSEDTLSNTEPRYVQVCHMVGMHT